MMYHNNYDKSKMYVTHFHLSTLIMVPGSHVLDEHYRRLINNRQDIKNQFMTQQKVRELQEQLFINGIFGLEN